MTFNPKLDMKDMVEHGPPPISITKKKKWPDTQTVLLIMAAAIAMSFLLWNVAYASSCVSESITSVISKHTVIFKKKC